MDDHRDALIGRVLEWVVAVGRPLAAERQHPFGDVTITSTQMHVLFVLAHRADSATVGELATLLGVTPAAVTQLVDALTARDLVTRAENPHDARSKFVWLTDAARAAVAQFEDAAVERARWRFDALTDGELESLARLMSKVEVRP